VKEYELSQVFHHPELEISNNEVTDPGIGPMETNLKSVYVASSIPKQIPNKIMDYFPQVANQGMLSSAPSVMDRTYQKDDYKKKNRKMKKSTLRHKKRRLKEMRE